MISIRVNVQKGFIVPAGADTLEIFHEWGDTALLATGLVAGTTYNYTPDSIGVHKFVWRAGTTTVTTDFYDVMMPLVTSTEFFADYPSLELEDEKFDATERRVRKLVEVFTGQQFGPITNKTYRIQGDGGDTLELPMRIRSFTAVTDQWNEDLTLMVEIATGEPYFLQYVDRYRAPFYQDYKRDLSVERRKQDFFTNKLDFEITGNFGWEYVPNAVGEAARLLIADTLNGTNDLRERGINEAQLGDFSYKLNADQWGTTGNTQADNLLADYVIMRIGNI